MAKTAMQNMANGILAHINYMTDKSRVYDNYTTISVVNVAVSKDDAKVVTCRGRQRLRITTCGWKLLVRWKDGSESWIHLKDLKESHPVELAEYAKARSIADKPAFTWWVPYTLRKRSVILSAVKARLRKTSH